MIIALTSLVAIAAISWVLGVRTRDLPEPEPVSPFAHLDERKAAIYENLRDLQFEYRLGKLSDADYQSTKKDLQKELAGVLAEVDRLKGTVAAAQPAAPAPKPKPPARKAAYTCDACGASFEKDLKFCGECGKPMKVAQ